MTSEYMSVTHLSSHFRGQWTRFWCWKSEQRSYKVVKGQIKSLKVIWSPFIRISIMVSTYLNLIERFDFFLTSFLKSTFCHPPLCKMLWRLKYKMAAILVNLLVNIWHPNDIWVWHMFLTFWDQWTRFWCWKGKQRSYNVIQCQIKS